MTYHILYNPLAASGTGRARAEELAMYLPGQLGQLTDLTQIRDYAALFASIPKGERILLTGGDGTLNRFLNDTADLELPEELWYAPTGTGNDFWTDIGQKPGVQPVNIRPYLDDLPSVSVNGTRRYFLNGIGYGIDGYCCLEGDRLRKVSAKPVNYTSIAIKGLLFHYKPTSATVIVDGVKHIHTGMSGWHRRCTDIPMAAAWFLRRSRIALPCRSSFPSWFITVRGSCRLS